MDKTYDKQETLRTDAKAQTFQRESEVGSMGERYYLTHEVVDASFARQLERELAMMTEAHETCKRCFAEAERALSAKLFIEDEKKR